MKDSWDGERDPLAALVEGRSGPFEAFVAAETRTFLAFFTRLGARRSEAEDLTQETLLKLFRLAALSTSHDAGSRADGGDPTTRDRPTYQSRGQFRGFAFRVARNVWIDRTRKRASEPHSVEEDLSAPDPSVSQPLDQIEQLEEAERVRAAVGTLSDAHRSVFELGVIEELPYAEISTALDIPIGTVKSRMFHAVHRVREALAESDRIREAIVSREQRAPAGGVPFRGSARPRTL
ncbi:ECF RNA polymerase sigma factor SigW [Planctomycetes bacterium Poly30]|uniref:ECF RNA polymerase sigma factor SigW n=1 Tax=Saltatorellus ferox TaxID=2528018 RepID=A0A518ETF9_9BACT|nr:ECF RNA polymerase sigma factor SigW [Planctomycetes bacterium Poly30]